MSAFWEMRLKILWRTQKSDPIIAHIDYISFIRALLETMQTQTQQDKRSEMGEREQER